MFHNAKSDRYLFAKILAVACIGVAALFYAEAGKGFSLWDEGFLWYGVQRVMAGETPILDFMSYDPGRYYWSMAWMRVLGGEGLMSLRATLAIVQAMGLFTGLWLVARSARSQGKDDLLFWFLAAATLLAWMLPRHKLFDVSLSIFLIGLPSDWVRNPLPRNYFWIGAGVGLVAVFGRNHGVYGAAGSFGVMVWLSLKRTSEPGFLKGFALWACGAAIGFSPILAMAATISGFTSAFLESVWGLLERGATNLALPVPWPWTADVRSLSSGDAIRAILTGCFFAGLPLFALFGIAWAVHRRLRGEKVERPWPPRPFWRLPTRNMPFRGPTPGISPRARSPSS